MALHLVSRILYPITDGINALLFLRYTGTSTWTALAVFFLQLLLFGLVLRTWIAPFILKAISKRIRIGSISLRSVRRLYVKTNAVTIKVDRIGISYHNHSSFNTRRFSLKIEGLCVELHKPRVPEKQKGGVPNAQSHSRTRSIRNLSMSSASQAFWSLYSAGYALVEPIGRPLIRACFVTSLRIIIRCLPVLTQAFDVEITSALVTLAESPGAYIAVRGTILSATISFSAVEEVILLSNGPSRGHSSRRYLGFLNTAHMRFRLKASTRRALERAWGRTKGRASFVLQIQEISCITDNESLSSTYSRIPDSSHLVADRFALVTRARSKNTLCIALPRMTEFSASFDFGPRKGIIEERSLVSSLKISKIEISKEPLMHFLRTITRSRANIRTALNGSEQLTNVSVSVAKHTAVPTTRRLYGAFQFPLFRSSEFFVRSLTIHLDAPRTNSLSGICFESEFDDIACSFFIDKSRDDAFHRDILGKRFREDSDLDADVLSQEFSIKRIAVHRYDSRECASSSKMISIGKVKLQGFATQWAPLKLNSTRYFSGDPNASLLAVKLDISSPQFNEQIDIINRILDEIRYSSDESPRHTNGQRLLRSVPRIRFDMSVNDVAACLMTCNRHTGQSSTLVLSSTQSHMTLSTFFRDSFAKTVHHGLKRDGHIPLEMMLSVESVLGPASVSILPQALSLDYSPDDENRGLGSFGEAIVTLGVVEMSSSGRVLGVSNEDIAIIDLTSSLLELQYKADAVSIELWQPSAMSSLHNFLTSIKDFKGPAGRGNQGSDVLDLLPSGLSVHFAVGQLGCLLAGKDLDPKEELGLLRVRGISAASGASLEFCTMHDRRKIDRLPRHSPHAHGRQRLHLAEDVTVRSRSEANTLADNDIGRGHLRCVIYNTVVRTAYYKTVPDHCSFHVDEEPMGFGASDLINIKRLEVNTVVRRTSLDDNISTGRSTAEMFIDVPYAQSHLQLSDFYCLFLAMSAANSLSVAFKKEKTEDSSDHPAQWWLRISLRTIQCRLKLPLGEEICIRVDKLHLKRNMDDNLTISWADMLLWVPPHRGAEKWEELARFRSWTVTIVVSAFQPFAIHISAEVARISIPYEYVLADLVLNLNVFVKCLRHLQAMISAGRFYSVASPEPESAKDVPTITLRIKSLSAEAADDPLESKLGLIWRAGLKFARSRLERDEAFDAKVAAIDEAHINDMNTHDSVGTLRFTPQHTVSIEDAYDRLLQVHSISWISLHRELRETQKRLETSIQRRIRGDGMRVSSSDIEPLVPLNSPSKLAPLLRIILNKVDLNVSKAFGETEDLAAFLHDVGNGVPRGTLFTLLIPLHLRLELGSSSVMLRDYPLPLISIKEDERNHAAWVIDAKVVLAEELGSESSVTWKDCPISFSDQEDPLTISVPKTTMPVKTYLNPSINVATRRLTEVCWCISYSPAIQDMMRVIDSLSTPPPDPSPPMGFWDKIRLQFHCRADFSFAGEVSLYLKGSRDPYETEGSGAGFALCWNGNTQMTIGKQNPQRELLQVISDTMLIVIPDFRKREKDSFLDPNAEPYIAHMSGSSRHQKSDRRFLKVCAKFTSGIRWGIGAIMERTCSVNCRDCNNTSMCRLFEFRPHYDIALEPKAYIPEEKTSADSFNGFRSDFVHLSTSLASPVQQQGLSSRSSNSFHLTPKVFAHFWSWWDLFDRSLALPVRQGRLFPNARPPSKKFGRHLATLKYKLAVSQLFISHVYTDDSRESWVDGVTNFVGLKALVSSFEADMHQREQEGTIPDVARLTLKKVRHKPFYAAEVKLVDLQVQAILATFQDLLKCAIDLGEHQRENRFSDAESVDFDASQRHWIDMDDFDEIDWTPTHDDPSLHMFSIGSCPRFSYFRRSSGNIQQARPDSQMAQTAVERSRFGDEDTHICLMDKEPSVHQLQSQLISERVAVLERELAGAKKRERDGQLSSGDIEMTEKKIKLLKRHLLQLQELDNAKSHDTDPSQNDYPSYLIPIDVSSLTDWTEFDNVYQFHCPKFSINNCVREILTQYYYCSRARRGLEYHLATRAVKFIRDQANAYAKASADNSGKDRRYRNAPSTAAQATVLALRKILTGNEGENVTIRNEENADVDSETFDPLEGWSEGVSLRKSHFCLLLRPQILLGETSRDSVVILTAVQAVLQSCVILDTVNAEDPISGRVMTRSHAVLSGLQAFSPSVSCPVRHDGVPLEVLIDLRAESDLFERLVPQTRATFRYDKFNRLRLRNNITSVTDRSADQHHAHLHNQTDLIDIKVPKFTVSADSRNFESIANIITNLLLQSDSAHKLHLNRVETLLFSYDFTDFSSSGDVVEGLQDRLRRTVERAKGLKPLTERVDEREQVEKMAIKARIFLLSEELNLIFDAIKLAQDKADDKHSDSKSALEVHAWSKEISWDMVNDVREIIAKVAVRGVDYTWLNRQDGSTVNKLSTSDLQAFDGSQDAEWPEILVKYREPASHPLVKMGIFVQADWTVLAPVGGIAIYETFMVRLHPMRLQLEARIGKSIMEYVWPARRNRRRLMAAPDTSHEDADNDDLNYDSDPSESTTMIRRASVDIPGDLYRRPSQNKRRTGENGNRLGTRQMTASRSFTDLRSTSRQNSQTNSSAATSSGASVNWLTDRSGYTEPKRTGEFGALARRISKEHGDAAEMKSRSLQKHFAHVSVPSMHIILSFHKDGSFFCRDARIQTRELEFRNRTFSFEELAEQFIPSDTSWRGWMRMALHQPLVPVLPVARELFSKTKWITAKGRASKKGTARTKAAEPQGDVPASEGSAQRSRRSSDGKRR